MNKCVICNKEVVATEPKWEFRYDKKKGGERRGFMHWPCAESVGGTEAWMESQSDYDAAGGGSR